MSISRHFSFKMYKGIISHLINRRHYFTSGSQPGKRKTTFTNIYDLKHTKKIKHVEKVEGLNNNLMVCLLNLWSSKVGRNLRFYLVQPPHLTDEA